MTETAMKRAARYALKLSGYEIRRVRAGTAGPALSDQPEWINEIIARVQHYTLTSPERIASLCQAIEYITRCNIPGDIVECGVWKGGSVMAAILALMQNGDNQRTIYLFDTFEGMSAPRDVDKVVQSGRSATEMMASADKKENIWAYSPLDEVQKNVSGLGYPSNRIVFVKGKVEETLPKRPPGKIALLRLDTDWYESTRHELTHLYPLLVSRGVLIIDDYGHWAGARKATDEYISNNRVPILLNRIDYTGRIAIKP
jgi:hypothetical protein